MNGFEQHPAGELLDRLRCGLLDDDPRERARLEQHLRHCADCRRAYDWPNTLLAAGDIPEARLQRLRRHALNAPVRRARRLLPLAAAAALIVAVAGLVNLSHQSASSPPARVAAGGQKVPDLYEDLDFYLWLADHKGNRDSST